ncbi:CLUMA_CG005171, isoform A [Clunio marinus]|uniref:CLUMA_CG005171, isoform A n=1 Tax=Clunio marinus TaxID=568069 RepID=A0A1J1HY96_9DIPT|nr:CLUMA_CG005171, isoform A [Clunio marinus]
MNYDDVLVHLGKFGSYQKRNYILLCLPVILCAFHKLAGVFLLGTPDHRCRLEGEPINSTFKLPESIVNVSFPFNSKENSFSRCEYFADNYFSPNDSSHEIVKCSDFVWDTSKYESSAVKSFHLICDHSDLKPRSDALLMVGVFIGSFTFGHLSDKYGRRIVFVLSLVFQLIFGVLIAIAPEFITFTICRMIVGATTSGVFLVAYCLSLEMVGKESRMVAGVTFMMFFSSGYMLMGGFAYFLPDWRWFQVAITLPGVIFLFYWWFIPESTRWLLANNRKDEAINQIQSIAKSNNVVIPQDVLDKVVEAESESGSNSGGLNNSKPSILDLFKTPNLRNKSLLIFFNWYVISGAYYGLSWSSGSSLSGDPIINHVLCGAVELPGYIVLLLTLNRFGRKKILSGNLIFAGTTLILSLIVPQNNHWLVLGLTLLGKMSITASYGTIYLFSVEQFPTVIRNVALGAASMSARVGGVSAPYLIYLSQFWKPLPILLFGVTAFIAGFLSTFLPETHNVQLPETLADGERLGKNLSDVKAHELSFLNKKMPNGNN